MTRNDFGIQRIPRRNFDQDFAEAERYRTLLTRVNGELIQQRGVRLVPIAADTPLGEFWQEKMPPPLPGVMDYNIEAGNQKELDDIAIDLGIDLTNF